MGFKRTPPREGYYDGWEWDEADGPIPGDEELLRLWAEHVEADPPLPHVGEGCGGSGCDICYPGET